MNRVLGTAAGAVIGSRIANSTDKRMINDCTITENYHNQNVISGYNVGYTIDGKNSTVSETEFQKLLERLEKIVNKLKR